MAANADLAAILLEQQVLNYATIMEHTVHPAAYQSEFNRYVEWVLSQPDLGTPAAPFLTRNNVDHYFTRVIAIRKGSRNTIRRVMNSLDWFGTHREHISASPKFKSISPVVEQAMTTQKSFNKLAGGTGNPGSDPHKGLKDILPESD